MITKLNIQTLVENNYKVITKGKNNKGKECLYVYEEKDSKPIDYIEVEKGLFVKYEI